MLDSWEMDFMKVIVILVKVDEIVQCLEACKPLFFGQEIKIELGDQSFCWSLPLNFHTFTTPLLYYEAGFIL